MAYTIQCTDAPSAELAHDIRERLNEFNFQITVEDEYRPLALYARDDQGELVAGLLGGSYWGWLAIDILWVREDTRGQGLGSQLLQAAEAEALRRGCRHVHVDTHDFQAPDFYQRHGYTVWGVLEDLPPGHRRFSLQKSLG
jgi:GNAT superfamily N-acetyltransferase